MSRKYKQIYLSMENVDKALFMQKVRGFTTTASYVKHLIEQDCVKLKQETEKLQPTEK